METLQLIERKLGGFGIEFEEELVNVTLAEVDQAIKNYCHIDCIPEALKFVRVGLTVDCIRYQQANIPQTDEVKLNTCATSKVGPLTYLTSGAITYGFGNSKTNRTIKTDIANAHIADLDTIVSAYITQLNAFRRAVW